MAIRVHELSKKLNIPTKELLRVLNEGGFEIRSHMSVLNEDAVNFVQKKYKKKSTPSNNKAKKTSANVKSYGQNNVASHKPSDIHASEAIPKQVVIEPMSVEVAAKKMGKPFTDVILTLLRWGVVAPKNYVLSEDLVKKLAHHYELEVVAPPKILPEDKEVVAREVDTEKLTDRLPIVVILGHVDHGKTTLLDYIRKTRVAAREKGGITQHLGAYEATTDHGNLIFLDTPGHEAFPKIRQRGVKAADLAVIIIAADDGIMPQTVEAINHAKNMNVPILVAINKIDKVAPDRIEIVKRQLAQYDLLPEDWGGEIVCAPISAKDGKGVDHLLEMLALQSEMMELRASKEGHGFGFVLESKLEKGRGPVATVIGQNGTINVGDYFKCGNTVGRVTSMMNSYGKRIKQAGPSVPVQIAGFEDLPQAGDYFEVIPKNDYLKVRMAKQKQKGVLAKRLTKEGVLNIIVKADTDSSKEALVDSIEKLSKKLGVGFNIVHASVGQVSESDVELAYNTGSFIVGLHVKTESKAQNLSQARKVAVYTYDIIYKLLEFLQEKVEATKEVEKVRKKIGQAHVLRVFDIKGVGVIAGCLVKDGKFVRNGIAVVWRGDQKIGEGKITSLQREKKSVKEVLAGYECGFLVEGLGDFQEGDRIECFIEEPAR